MSSEVVSLALELINIESISGSEKPMADFLDPYLSQRGWRVVRQKVVNQRENIYAHRPGREPKLLFNSHIDTVPPFFPASIGEGWIHGRGACDTKSLIAAQLLAGEQLVAEGHEDFGFLYVVGEEVDHCGMIKANELGLKPEALIVGEPTESKLVRGQKGVLKARLICRGKAAHSGYPHTGVSAVDPLLDVLRDIRQAQWPSDDVLGATTVNIGILKGGRAANVVPDHAYAEVMFRVVSHWQEIHEKLIEIVGDRAECEMISSNDPWALATLDGYETVVVAFNTDIPYYRFDGRAFLWGAGSILDAHTAGEKIKIEDLERAVGVYRELALQCLRN